jgi:hypothetical protein
VIIRYTTISVCQTVEPFKTNRIKIIWHVIRTDSIIIPADSQPESVEIAATMRRNWLLPVLDSAAELTLAIKFS